MDKQLKKISYTLYENLQTQISQTPTLIAHLVALTPPSPFPQIFNQIIHISIYLISEFLMQYHQFQKTDTSTSHQRVSTKPRFQLWNPDSFLFFFFGLGKTQIQNTQKSQTLPPKPIYLKLLSN